MKKLFLIATVLILLGGCESFSKALAVSQEARSLPFDHFFPQSASVKSFETLNEAFAYISVAEEKMRQSSGKSLAKGLAGRLSGNFSENKDAVTVVTLLGAQDLKGSIPLVNAGDSLQSKVHEAVSVLSVYMVVYQGKGVVVTDFYLDSGFIYSANDMVYDFSFPRDDGQTERLTAEYPVGWGTAQALTYLSTPAP